jgi:hypothetical protein
MRTSGTSFRSKKPGSAVPLGQILTCLLLGVLFLFNPFLAAGGASGHLTVCHPASHRATVGSCELEKFAQPNATASALPNLSEVEELLPSLAAVDSAERRTAEQGHVVRTPQTGFSASLWFRPPPTV